MNWISINDELPHWDQKVMVAAKVKGLNYHSYGFCWLTKVINTKKGVKAEWTSSDNYGDIESITHWTPMPEPPKTK
jgi:hypothetical protein